MATAAPPQIKTEQDEKECSICHERFTHPKLLPCGHLLCRDCLLSLLKSFKHEASCPLCRCTIIAAHSKQLDGFTKEQSWEEAADDFPTDLAMAAQVKAESVLGASHVCCACEDVAATSMCLDCEDAFCAACTRLHKKQKVSRNHVVEDLASLTAEKLGAHPSSGPTCPSHEEKPCDLFCESHDVAICHICFVAQHRHCPDVRELQEKAEESRKTLSKIANKLKAADAKLTIAIAELDLYVDELEKMEKEAVVGIDSVCDELEKAVRDCRHRLKDKLFSACGEARKNSGHRKAVLVQRQRSSTSHFQMVKRAQEAKRSDVLVSSASSITSRFRDLKLGTSLLNAPARNRVVFRANDDAIAKIRQDLVDIGHVMELHIPIPLRKSALKKGDESSPCGFPFSHNHGKNVTLMNNDMTAKRIGSSAYDGLVIGSTPMVQDTLYEVALNTVLDNTHTATQFCHATTPLYVGVFHGDPKTVVFPSCLRQWSSAVVIRCCTVSVYCKMEENKVGLSLCSLRENARVGLLLAKDGQLYLFVNGECRGKVAPNLKRPCYPIFDLFRYVRQVTTLPTVKLRLEDGVWKLW